VGLSAEQKTTIQHTHNSQNITFNNSSDILVVGWSCIHSHTLLYIYIFKKKRNTFNERRTQSMSSEVSSSTKITELQKNAACAVVWCPIASYPGLVALGSKVPIDCVCFCICVGCSLCFCWLFCIYICIFIYVCVCVCVEHS
jgi:hypothetical protein